MPQTLTPITADSSTYGTRAGIEGIYGTFNVASYADLNGNQDADEIAAQIGRAEDYAYALINSKLRTVNLTVPATSGNFPDFALLGSIEDELAGAWLYFSRGSIDNTKDADGQMQWHWDHALAEIDRLIANAAAEDDDDTTNAPGTFQSVGMRFGPSCGTCDENGCS